MNENPGFLCLLLVIRWYHTDVDGAQLQPWGKTSLEASESTQWTKKTYPQTRHSVYLIKQGVSCLLLNLRTWEETFYADQRPFFWLRVVRLLTLRSEVEPNTQMLICLSPQKLPASVYSTNTSQISYPLLEECSEMHVIRRRRCLID